jgi:DNA-binding Lrp family transcriptional regulator
MHPNIKIPQISKQIYNHQALNVLESNYSAIGPQWTVHQMEWTNSIYSAFKDHDKYMIVIYLVKKTLDFYSRNFVKLTYDQFYSKDKIEIEEFNIIELSKNLNIPKESARRKIVELEKSLVIKREKKKLILDRSSFLFVKPINSVKRISRFISSFSHILKQEKILPTNLTTEQLEKVIKNNFSYVWKIYYEFQIPMLLAYKKVFKNIESFHIFGTCVVNQHLRSQKLVKGKLQRSEFIKNIYSDKNIQGVNAMSISEITGIPRATVVRKLKVLVKNNILSIDDKKHYKLTGNSVKELVPIQNIVINQLANFSTKIFNLAIL